MTNRQSGISLIELMAALAVFVIGGLGALTAMLSSIRLDRTNREGELARQAVRQVAEQMKGTTPFSLTLASYDSAAANDPSGAGTAPGSTFVVRGLSPQAGSATVGTIVFPTTGTALREDSTLAELGMPRDLNGDGVVDAADHAADYFVLPVEIRVRWRGVDGNRTYTLRTVLCQ